MRLKNLFKKTPASGDNSLGILYELLFCDDIELYKRHIRQPSLSPWNILFSDNSSCEDLQLLVDNPLTESRVKLIACRKMMSLGQKPARKELFAIIVEVGLEEGTDVLASFGDGTTRYINQSGKVIVWETRDTISDMLTSELFYESEKIVRQIGPWDEQQRLAPPARGLARISFLMSDGLYFGQAPVNDLFNDPLAKPALTAATLLMQHIAERALERNQ